MKKKYIARIETPNVRLCFVFESEHRANSIGNYIDARTTWYNAHGYRPQIINTYLAKDCDKPVGMILS